MTLFYISALAAGDKSQTMLSKKVKLLTKQARIPRSVCGRPMTAGTDVTLRGSHTHTHTLERVCVC